MKKYCTPSSSDQDRMVKGQKSEVSDRRRGMSDGKSEQTKRHPPPPPVHHHNPQQHHKHQSDDDSLNTQSTAEDSIFTENYPDHVRCDASKTSSLKYRRKTNHRQQTLSETSFSSSTTSSSPSSSSSFSSSFSYSSSTYSSSTSESHTSLSSHSSAECLAKDSLQKAQHSQSCNDISRKHKYFDDDDDMTPLINDESQTYKSPVKEKKSKGHPSGYSSAHGTLRNTQRRAPGLERNGNVRKAKSMEALTSPTDGDRHEVEDEEEQERRKKDAREKLMKEKRKFSAFLNEITRQVLSPMRLTTLGVTDAQRPSSPRSPSVRSRKEENCTKKQQAHRTASADSVCSSKTSYSTVLSHSRSFHNHPSYLSEESHHLPRKPRSCNDITCLKRHGSCSQNSKKRSCSPLYKHCYQCNQGEHQTHRQPRRSCHSPAHRRKYIQSPIRQHHRGRWRSPDDHHMHRDQEDYYYDYTYHPHHHNRKGHSDHYRPGHHHLQGDHHEHDLVQQHEFHRGHGPRHVRALSERGPRCRPAHHQHSHGSAAHHHGDSTSGQHHSIRPNVRQRHLSQGSENRDQHRAVRHSSSAHQFLHKDHQVDHEAHPKKGFRHHNREHTRQSHPHKDHHSSRHPSCHKECYMREERPQQSRSHQNHRSSPAQNKAGDQHSPSQPQHHEQQQHASHNKHQHADHHGSDHRHHHRGHHSTGHQHHDADQHVPTHSHLQGDQQSPGHHEQHHRQGHQHQHGDNLSSGHRRDDHHGAEQHHHQENNSRAAPQHRGDHPHHQDNHHSPGPHHHGRKHVPDHQPNSDGGHHQHRDHRSQSHHHKQSDVNPHQHGDGQTHQHLHGDHHIVDNQHEDTKHRQPDLHGDKSHHHNPEDSFVNPQTHSVRRPDSPPPKRQMEYLSSQPESLSLTVLEEEQTSFTSASLYQEKTLELDKIMVLPGQNEGLHQSLLKTAVRMECLGEEVINSQKLLEAELQRTRVELSGLTERFKRLHDNCSTTQQTNTLLEQKLQSVAQNMEAERERLNRRISALTEKLADVKLANSRKNCDVPQKSDLLTCDAMSQVLLPITPPPAQFMDEQSFGMAKAPGQDQCLGSVPEEEESDWSEMGEETPRLILTGFNRNQTWVRMEEDHKLEMEGIVRCPSPRPMQIPQLQFTVHNEIFPPPPPTTSCPPSLNNMSLGMTCEDAYTFGPSLSSSILVRSASLEELPMALHQLQSELRGTEAIMDLHNPGDEGIEISDNEIIHHWRSNNNMDIVTSEGESSLESAEQRFSHFLFSQHGEGKGLSRGEVHGWTGGIPDEVLNGERTEL
ncbi:uncharacterized protein ACB058_016653 [Synchiropus picturatus]